MSPAPRVLVSGVVLGQPMGGVRRHNSELLPRAARLLAAADGGLAVLEGRDAITFALPEEIDRLASRVPAGPPTARAMAEGRALAEALDQAEARGRPFDLVHTAHLPVPRRLAAPYTFTLHDLRALELPSAPFVRRLLAGPVIGGALRGAARVAVVSETVRAQVLERFDLEEQRVHVVPNAADHLTPRPRAPRPDAPLLCVGHLETRKNLELVIRALAGDPGLPDLVLAGAPKGDEGERLAALAGELGLSERVRLCGPFEEAELPELYATCACVVVPSRVEGFGLAALEAQRAGAPLAVAEAGALPEVAPTAPRFPTDDATACAAAIRDALDQDEPTLQRARSLADAFTWDDSARRLVELWSAAALD